MFLSIKVQKQNSFSLKDFKVVWGFESKNYYVYVNNI